MQSKSPRRDLEKATAENVRLRDRIAELEERARSLKRSLESVKKSKKKMRERHEEEIAKKDAIIKELTNKLAHMSALANRDGTNSGIPTSRTPIGKNKNIPNTRRNTGKGKGGQPGHEKHVMEQFDDSEVTDRIQHELDTSEKKCGICGEALCDTGRTVSKDEFDVSISVRKRRHDFHIYKCMCCGREYREKIDPRLKEKNQYGSTVQALALSLMATGNVAINKVGMLIKGMTSGQMAPSEGFISKLNRRASDTLAAFMADLKKELIRRPVVYWDDTVVMVMKQRACMRFYGDETISYYTAHMKKDLDSLIEDNVLDLLTKETLAMHDHNTVNYNERFCYGNIECNQHLERDLQKSADDNPDHSWAKKLKKLISSTIGERKDRIAAGESGFTQERKEKFYRMLRRLINKGYKESAVSTNPTTTPSEPTLLARLEKYKENYFLWVEDFNIPTTNNLAERGLRSIKSHMKISGQFESEKTASYYAAIKTYVETCRKNNINEMTALTRLCEGNPITVKELFG